MFRKLLIFILIAGVCAITPASAQDTIGIYADFGEGEGLARSIITKPGTPFDVVVVANTYRDSGAAEFVMTELMLLYSGVFKFQTTKVNNTPLDLGDNQVGEYLLAFAACIDAGLIELVRIRYYDLDGAIGPNVVLSLSGFGPDASMPSSFDGGMGYVDCEHDELHALTPEPWDESSDVDPKLIAGVDSTEGILVINPEGITVPAGVSSMGSLKSRF